MTRFDTDVQIVKMRRREIEAMISLIKRQQEFLTADESAALQRFEDARMENQMTPDQLPSAPYVR